MTKCYDAGNCFSLGNVIKEWLKKGHGGGRAADSGPCDPSSIPLGEKKENKQERHRGCPIKKESLKNELHTCIVPSVLSSRINIKCDTPKRLVGAGFLLLFSFFHLH